ncbi:MAG: adenine nucleotide alpha hydrolase family protein [Promethearchaeota archaeon]|nr:MAG: adenine nucleotide alpha hydrolase family protein [Candidatus Lokiarchaeota archaeon]
MPKCKFYRECQSQAVTQIPYTKMALCKNHFLRYMESRVYKTIETHKLIDFQDPHEKVLVAVSGGKDSQTLLTILQHVLVNKVPLEALYIEVGISPDQYSHDSEDIAKKFCDELGVPFHVLNIQDHLGFDMDKIHQLGNIFAKGNSRSKNKQFRGDCSYCGLLKRYYINFFAVQNGFSKVATGHNLTDEATQLLSNFFSVDTELMSRAGPSTTRGVEGLVDRIKPLFYIYETELILYAYYGEVPHLPTECAYAGDSPMIQVKRSLEKIESFRRGTMMNMVRDFQKKLKPILFKTIPEERQIVNKCNQCGMTTYLEMCAFCRTTNRLREDLLKYHIIED